jgi:DNA processing protein
MLLTEGERRDRLRLIKSENVGPVTFETLLKRFGTATAAIAAIPELSRRGGLRRLPAISSRESAERDIERARELGATFVAPGEPGYPPLLSFIEGAPPLLCIKGDPGLAGKEAVAIVGSRNASAGGRKFARVLAGDLATAGFVIISGLARGIDTAAHEAALERGTAAVLAGGIDVVYPPENVRLQEAIGSKGLLVTEMIPGTIPRAEHFPRRNRIISGTSRAVVVIEAAARSGSLITARLAAEQGREVFAVPGSPLDPRSAGTNGLIKNGASLLSSSADVIQALSAMPSRHREASLSEPGSEPLDASTSEREHIMSMLSHSPVGIDDLIRESGVSPSAVIGVVLELEPAGRAARQGGHLVSLI